MLSKLTSFMSEIDNNDIIFIGKSAHGSTPELGVNAAVIAIKELANFYPRGKNFLYSMLKFCSSL